MSALFPRLRSRSRLPPLGTVLRDQQAVDALAQWMAHDLVRSH